MDIFDTCIFYNIDLTKLPKNLYKKLKADFNINTDLFTLSIKDIEEYKIPDIAIIIGSKKFDKNKVKTVIINIIGKYPFYLIYSKSRLSNASEYMITTDFENFCVEYTLIPFKYISHEKRKVIFENYNFDNYVDCDTYIMGINEEELKYLKDNMFDPNIIEEFIDIK